MRSVIRKNRNDMQKQSKKLYEYLIELHKFLDSCTSYNCRYLIILKICNSIINNKNIPKMESDIAKIILLIFQNFIRKYHSQQLLKIPSLEETRKIIQKNEEDIELFMRS